MNDPAPPSADSLHRGGALADHGATCGGIGGGSIPGLVDAPAFTQWLPAPSPIPVVIAVPHAGRAYPAELLERMRQPAFAVPRLEDRLVDRIGIEVAGRTGAALLVAHAPRAMIDLNRAGDDIDWDMIIGGAANKGSRTGPNAGPVTGMGGRTRGPAAPAAMPRARSGLGLVPRRLPGAGELWKRPLERAELAARIASVHAPYHAALADMLETVRARWGAVLLIDLHSMPPLPARSHEPAAEFVVGDRFGAACDGALVAEVFACLGQARRLAAHNRPYAGGYVLERHARRAEGVHCLQLEICRQAYLDAALAEPGPGLAKTVEVVTTLVQRMAAAVAELGRTHQQWRAAAE